jgi:hypothetical protein
MWAYLHPLLRWATAGLGVAFIVMAFFLYPDEEGKIQSTFEDIWNRLRRQQDIALSRHAAFMVEMARTTSLAFDRLLGFRLLSQRAFGVSICYSAASVGLVGLAANLEEPQTLASIVTMGAICASFLLIGSLPALCPSFRFKRIWFYSVIGVPFFLLSGSLVLDSGLGPLRPSTALKVGFTVGVIMLASFSSDVLFIALTRRALRWAGQMDQFLKIAAVVFLNCLLAACLLVAPLAWSIKGMEDYFFEFEAPSRLTVPFFFDVLVVSASNAIDALAASLFLLLAALMLIHRFFWPLLNRTLFRVQDLGIKGRRLLLASVGLALLIATRELPDWFKEIVKAFSGGG